MTAVTWNENIKKISNEHLVSEAAPQVSILEFQSSSQLFAYLKTFNLPTSSRTMDNVDLRVTISPEIFPTKPLHKTYPKKRENPIYLLLPTLGQKLCRLIVENKLWEELPLLNMDVENIVWTQLGLIGYQIMQTTIRNDAPDRKPDLNFPPNFINFAEWGHRIILWYSSRILFCFIVGQHAKLFNP